MKHSQQYPVEMSLDQCIKCNICTTVCPVSAVTDLFPGPKYVGPQAARFRQPDQPAPDLSVDYCSGCRACNLACPTGVKIAEINARARFTLVEQGKVPWLRRLRNNLLARAATIGKLAQPVAPLANLALSFNPLRQLIEWTLGIHHHAPFPVFSRKSFTSWVRKRRISQPLHRQVVYFHGCSTQYYEPRIGRAAVHVLEKNGIEVIVPPQNCCGLPLLSNGEFKAARKYHQNNVRYLIEYARLGIPILGTSTSCTLTLKEEAPELLDMHDPDTQTVANQTYDIHEYLVMLLEEGSLNTEFNPLPLTLGYHPPCQYRGHRLGTPSIEILRLIPELKLVESQATCCGVAGTYGYKAEKYQIAMQVGQPLFDFVEELGQPLVVCDSETCRWHITKATGKPAIHPVELVAAAYGFEVEGALQKELARKNLQVSNP